MILHKVSKKEIYFFFILILITAGTWGFSWYIITTNITGWESRGQFGDMFGAINALFSGLAFAGLIYTIYLQAKQIKDQSDQLNKQNFETTFFNMLSNIQSITDNMVSPDGKKRGRSYLHELFEDFAKSVTDDHRFQDTKLVADSANKDLLKDKVLEKYDKFFEINSYNLGHFYRSTHNLLKMIEFENKDIEIRKRYSSIFQAHLSNDELGFILYNSLSTYSLNKNGQPEFHRMIDELNILENIADKCVFDKILVEYFPNTNFFFTRNSEGKTQVIDAKSTILSKESTIKKCHYCKEEIHELAKVCKYCGKNQNKLTTFFNNIYLVPNLISIGLLILTFFQFKAVMTEKELVFAEKDKAHLAFEKITLVEARIDKTKDDINKTKDEILILSKAVRNISLIIPRSTNQRAGLTKEDYKTLQISSSEIKQIINGNNL